MLRGVRALSSKQLKVMDKANLLWLACGEKDALLIKIQWAEITNWFQIQALNPRLGCISGEESFLSWAAVQHLQLRARVEDAS